MKIPLTRRPRKWIEAAVVAFVIVLFVVSSMPIPAIDGPLEQFFLNHPLLAGLVLLGLGSLFLKFELVDPNSSKAIHIGEMLIWVAAIGVGLYKIASALL